MFYVTCPLTQIIEVKFEKFDVERDNYCRYDYVAIFNGAEVNDAKRIGKYCGDSPPAYVTHLFLLRIFLANVATAYRFDLDQQINSHLICHMHQIHQV